MTNAEARFNKSHIRKVYVCLAVTCHLHFWQNDRDFLRATVVTRGWNGYRNKSQHRKSTLHTTFNTLDNWAIKTPPNQKGKGPERKGYRVMARNMYTIHSVTYIYIYIYIYIYKCF